MHFLLFIASTVVLYLIASHFDNKGKSNSKEFHSKQRKGESDWDYDQRRMVELENFEYRNRQSR